MTFGLGEIAADSLRRLEASAHEPLGSRYIDHMAVAAEEYRRAKRELLALRTDQASEDALQAASERLANARMAVKRAIKI
jgi:hypothetical protein